VGISADQVDRQLEFDDANALGFPLLSDPGRDIARRYGVVRKGLLPNKRRTFVVGRGGSVLTTVRSELNMRIHADRALETLRKTINP
jgi:peroxiredoxin Q/BCP